MEEREFDQRLGVDRDESAGGWGARRQQQLPERGRAVGGRRFDDVFDRKSDAQKQKEAERVRRGGSNSRRDDWESLDRW